MPRRVLVLLDGKRRTDGILARLDGVCGPLDHLTLLLAQKPSARKPVGTRQARSAAIRFADYGVGARFSQALRAPVFETREQARERQLAIMTHYLNLRADEMQQQGYRVAIQAIVHEAPAKAVIDYAGESKPDLVLAPRHTFDPRRFLFASTARQLAKAHPAPVVFLPLRRGDWPI